MKKTSLIAAVTLAAIASTALSTSAIAERGPGRHADGPRGGPAHMMPVLNFEELDTDKDGRITKAEIDAQRQARVTAADANGDGLLNAEELAAMELAKLTERAADHAARMIERFDANADGQISAAEMAAGPQPVAMFDRIDTDSDGAITQAEADAAREKMGERMKHRRGGWGDSN